MLEPLTAAAFLSTAPESNHPATPALNAKHQLASILLQGTKAARPAKPAASNLPVPAEGVRNIKNMWEKGNVFSSPSGTGTPNKVRVKFYIVIIKNYVIDLTLLLMFL